MMLVDADVDVEHRADFFEDIQAGKLTRSLIVPLDHHVEGGALCVVAALLRGTEGPRPVIDPILFVRRDGTLRMVFSTSHDKALSDREQADAERVSAWYDDWHARHGRSVRERLREMSQRADP